MKFLQPMALSYAEFSRIYRLQNFNVGNLAEYLYSQLDLISGFLVPRLSVTLINVTNHSSKFMIGDKIDLSDLVSLNPYYSFTFESRMFSSKAKYNLNTRTSGNYATITLTPIQVQSLDLYGDRSSKVLTYLYYMVGHCIRHMVVGNNTVKKNIMRLSAEYVLKNFGYNSWPYNLDILENYDNLLGNSIITSDVKKLYDKYLSGEYNE